MTLGFGAGFSSTRSPDRTIAKRDANPKLLHPVSDRVEILRLHARAARIFADEEISAIMHGSTETSYSNWWNNGRKGKNPIFPIDVDIVVAAIKNLSISEVREYKANLFIICRVNRSCPVDFVEARDAANERLAEIGF